MADRFFDTLHETADEVADVGSRLVEGSSILNFLGDQRPMDQAALATSFVPGVGDVMGAAADASMYINEPETRTWGNLGMSAAGLLPLVPGASALRALKGGRTPEQFLTEAERGKLNKGSAESLMNYRGELPTAKEMVNVARAGEAKKGWYKGSSQAIEDLFPGDDAQRFVGTLAAGSPRVSVEGNLFNTTNIWKNWNAAGRPTERDAIIDIMSQSVQGGKGRDSVMDAWINNTVRALSDDPSSMMLSGPKVDSFMRNLMKDSNELTNDAWMARYGGIPQTALAGSKNLTDAGKGPAYLAMNSLEREAADRLSQKTGELWTPDQVQETIWSFSKALRESQGAGRDTLDVLRQGRLTDDIIADTPDFGTLLRQEPYGGILQDAGVDLGRLADPPSRQETDYLRQVYGESPSARRDLERAARRLR